MVKVYTKFCLTLFTSEKEKQEIQASITKHKTIWFKVLHTSGTLFNLSSDTPNVISSHSRFIFYRSRIYNLKII